MDGACSAYGGEERRIQGFGREGDHLGDLGVDGKVILRCIFRNWDGGGGLDWIELAQNTDWWWTLVNAVVNLRVP